MEQYKNKFVVVTFIDNANPPETFVEPVPWKWMAENSVYWPTTSKLMRKQSCIDSTPDYNNNTLWEKCELLNIKSKL